jgi:hypothetical protein
LAKRRTYTSPDESFALIEWALDEGDDVSSMRLVKKANPAPWQTIEKLRRRFDSPAMTPGRWARYACGLWTAGEDPEITGAMWDPWAVDIGKITDGEEVVLAPSVGQNGVIGIAARRPDGKVALRAELLEPEDGTSMLVRVENRIIELCDRYQVLAVHHPLGVFLRSADLLEARGIPMVETPHSPVRVTAATGTFDRLLRGKMLMHDGDPATRVQVLQAQKKTSETGERYEISNRSRAVIALAFAAHAATALPPEEPMVVAL